MRPPLDAPVPIPSSWQQILLAQIAELVTRAGAMSLATRLHVLVQLDVLPVPASALSVNNEGGGGGGHLVSTMFWRQKSFRAVEQALLSALRAEREGRSTGSGSRVAVLAALCSLSRTVPLAMLSDTAELAAAAVELLAAATSTAPIAADISASGVGVGDLAALNVALSLLHTLTSTIMGGSESSPLFPHISTVVPLLVTVAQLSSAANRAAALRTLHAFAALPYPRLFPVKAIIFRGLAKVCDDNKRSIRLLAARVRNEFSTL